MWEGIGRYDVLLVVVVSIHATILAYLPSPRWKALLFSLPIPFTFSLLVLGQPIDATNVFGILLVMGFLHGVRAMHERVRLPIVPSIAVGVLAYSFLGWMLARFVPRDEVTFWIVSLVVCAIALALERVRHGGKETFHRSSLSVWAKLPIVVAIVVALILVKNQLRGFMTMFPLVSIFTAYETRHSLWMLCRQVPVMTLAMLAMMAVCRLTQTRLGPVDSLLLGWIAFLGITLPLTRAMWAASETK
ncbi:MAG: hypothetical protein EXS18_05245 [Verrucomicrobiae bacterium]|nr:hypothetical protein [Verrucomicrobiae bacterium]